MCGSSQDRRAFWPSSDVLVALQADLPREWRCASIRFYKFSRADCFMQKLFELLIHTFSVVSRPHETKRTKVCLHRKSVKFDRESWRTASSGVRRYMHQRAGQSDAYRARTARRRRHQLRSSGFGLLKARGFVRFCGLGRGVGSVCLGMGNGFGLGCCLRHASSTTSLTRTVRTCTNGVMQNHQRETISTGL